MGHAGLSSLLVLLLPLLLASLQTTTAARVPDQETAEDERNTLLSWCFTKDCLCNISLPFPIDSETASVIKAMLRESPDFSPFEDAIIDYSFFDEWCNDSSNDTNSTAATTTDSNTNTTETASNSTPEPTPSTSETPTSTTEDSTSTSEASISSSAETSTESSSSETPPLVGLALYTETQNELDEITTILDNFIALVEPQSEVVHVESVASARRVWGGRDLPVAWWQRRKSSRPRLDSDICETNPDPDVDTTTCTTLETQLQETDDLVDQLTEDVDAWQDADLKELTSQREGLQATYVEASADGSTFAQSVSPQFTEVVSSVKDNVQSGSSVVDDKIATYNSKNSGSIALVATLGSVGGLMVVSLIGVTIYGAVQKSKAKKKLSPKKAKNEDIPIDAYAHDGPGARSPPKRDPYSAAPVPAPRNYQHPGHFDPRREPVYPEPISGRPQQGLRRTNY